MSTRLQFGIPIDQGMRIERRERVVRPTPEAYDEYDPEDPTDHGPHVDRVGMVAMDADYEPGDDIDPDPEPVV